jgi:hypothetical protein
MWIIEINRLPWMGIYLFPFILIRKGMKPRLRNQTINHERIHHAQCLELGVIGFYILYLFLWLANLIKYWSFSKAYKKNPFELEAYTNEDDVFYLDRRNLYNWIRYKY